MATPLIAEVSGETIGGLMLFHFGGIAWYFYGMSTEKHREKMPSYLLQWKAICTAREMGCRFYDFWGAPDEFSETDGMWGVYRFKTGFGGKVYRGIGAWDFITQPSLYPVYNLIRSVSLSVQRWLGEGRRRVEK
jgi:lipid II:glycine glycyltransferase (peptidoglycan interpeptide bridge formation enzyme)